MTSHLLTSAHPILFTTTRENGVEPERAESTCVTRLLTYQTFFAQCIARGHEEQKLLATRV